MTTLKTGMKPWSTSEIKLKFHKYLYRQALPYAPKEFGHVHESAPSGGWGMLANDEVGDCTIAGIMHGQMVWDWATNNTITKFDDDVARKQYFALTGGVDSGLNPVEVASFWQNDGLIDASGKTHKVAAYAAINTPNDLIESAYLFGFSGLGVFLPDNAIPQFIAGKVWDDTSMPMNPQHGHFIPVVGRNSHGNLMVVTWGRLHAITQKWLDRYFAGGVAYISQEYFNKTGVSPEGFNFKQLSDDLTQLGSDNG